MVVAVARVRFRLPASHSLKGKRKVMKSLLSQVRHRYNMACSETDFQDIWQSAEIGICTVGNSEPVLSSAMEKVLGFLESTCPCEIVDSELEIIHMGRR